MKKLILLFSLICTLFIGTTACAYSGYPEHLNGDPNFILVDAHMGTGWYLDRSSLYVESYNPPQYIIVVNVCTVPKASTGNINITKVQTMRFSYNWDLGRMYIGRYNYWSYLRPNGPWSETGVSMPAGEMAFFLAYNLRFYGVYPTGFYQRAY